MSSRKSFADFVTEKPVENSQKKFDPERQIQQWQNYLETLYTTIEEFLKEFIEAGQAEFKRKPLPFQEESLGAYVADSGVLRVGQYKYILQPKGTMLIGSKGRVDIIGPKGTRFVALITGDGPKVTVTVSTGDSPVLAQKAESRPEWRWAIISERPPYKYTDFTKENFEELLMELG